MQYNKDEFKYFYDNYIGIKNRIEETKNIINELLQNDKLKETLEFYNDLDKEKQIKFNRINCNMGFIRYKLNKKLYLELEKGLDKLYKDFIESEAFPFSKDEFHFFVSNDTYLVDAINGEDSSELSKEENMLLSDSITSVCEYNPTDYSSDDIPLIKVLYLKDKLKYERKDSPLDIDGMIYDIDLAKRIDSGEYTYKEKSRKRKRCFN